jgi:formylglycine-generating enzyme required for sulfatase activity/DNA-binding NarL/FixJ family response regulator
MRILLVDDDPGVLQAHVATLKTLPGCEVRAAITAAKALENAAAANGVDVLITDVVMEPMDGFSLRNELAQRWPAMRTIFLTGYDLSDYTEQIGDAQVLQKPVPQEALAEAIQAEMAKIAARRAAPLKALATPVAATGSEAYSPEQVSAGWEGSNGAEASNASAIDYGGGPRFDTSEFLGLIGQTIGGYQILALVGEGRWGPVFAAVQTAINRPVGLKVLAPSLAIDESQKQRFIADARAKANVQHPSILSVYEAGAAEHWIFFTQEFVDGQHLAELAAQGRTLDGTTVLKIIRNAAEGLLYFSKNTIPHTRFQASDVYLGLDGQPRLSNLATQLADEQATVEEEIEILGAVCNAVLPVEGIAPGIRMMLNRTQQTHPSPILTWEALLMAVKALEPKVVPIEAAKISAQDRAAVESVEKARKQQKRAFMMNVGAMVSLVLLAIWAVWFVWFRSNERALGAQVHIPAGDFISGDGTNSKNDEFWIDKYETTIGQYAKFVEWVEQNPGEEHAFDHPKQPKQFSHRPQYWDIYYQQAATGGKVHGVPTDLNAPANMVTWWDAYAYAKWKGRELPTELEWERAARGTTGLAFPWGEEPDAKRANTNSDYNPRDPAAKGAIDGFNFWGDVDKQSSDKSPDGVIGMAGNVSEWTVDWTPDNHFPIIKGGNYTKPLVPLSDRIANHDGGVGEEYIGFRTVSHKAP